MKTGSRLAVEEGQNSIECAKMKISGTEIVQFKGEKAAITVPREKIRRIKLSYDSRAGNPFCQFFLGFIMLALGSIGMITIFLAAVGRPTFFQSGAEGGSLPLFPVVFWLMIGTGIWCLAVVFQSRYQFLIETEGGTCKLFFDKSTDVEDIRRFVRKAHMYFGYDIDASILDKEKTVL